MLLDDDEDMAGNTACKPEFSSPERQVAYCCLLRTSAWGLHADMYLTRRAATMEKLHQRDDGERHSAAERGEYGDAPSLALSHPPGFTVQLHSSGNFGVCCRHGARSALPTPKA